MNTFYYWVCNTMLEPTINHHSTTFLFSKRLQESSLLLVCIGSALVTEALDKH
jgi:hypothetical protein